MPRVPFLRDELIKAGLSPEDADKAVDVARLFNDARVAELSRMVEERNEVIGAVRAVRLKSFGNGYDPLAAAYGMKYFLGQALGLETDEELRENPATVRYPDLGVEFNNL
jgi:hypothetical protein